MNIVRDSEVLIGLYCWILDREDLNYKLFIHKTKTHLEEVANSLEWISMLSNFQLVSKILTKPLVDPEDILITSGITGYATRRFHEIYGCFPLDAYEHAMSSELDANSQEILKNLKKKIKFSDRPM